MPLFCGRVTSFTYFLITYIFIKKNVFFIKKTVEYKYFNNIFATKNNINNYE